MRAHCLVIIAYIIALIGELPDLTAITTWSSSGKRMVRCTLIYSNVFVVGLLAGQP